MKKRRLTIKLRNRTYDITEQCWKDAVKEITYNEPYYSDSDRIAISSLYLAKLIALPSKVLEDILFLHSRNVPMRADRTVEYIVSELTRRSLLDDSSQSDTIYKTKKRRNHEYD